ncbi:MAG: hypothetical protein DIU52_006585 [bacterium]|jgi:hypothetical protein|nr:MAG: hypothetical protein DIU52_13425 [bacterium]
MSMDEERLADEVSRLYWETDASVGEIAAELDISRRALYAALRPLPAGERCAACGGELVFMTRSARAEGAAECVACGREQNVAPAGTAADEHEAAGSAAAREAEAEDVAAVEGYGAALGMVRNQRRGVLLVAAALAGVAVGVIGAMRVLRR